MDILQKKEGNVDIFELVGKLDSSGSQKAQEVITSAIPKNGKLIIDMSRCDYVASSGLRVLLITAKQSALVDCQTVLSGIQPLVWDVIVMTGFEDVLEVFKSQSDALAGLA